MMGQPCLWARVRTRKETPGLKKMEIGAPARPDPAEPALKQRARRRSLGDGDRGRGGLPDTLRVNSCCFISGPKWRGKRATTSIRGVEMQVAWPLPSANPSGCRGVSSPASVRWRSTIRHHRISYLTAQDGYFVFEVKTAINPRDCATKWLEMHMGIVPRDLRDRP